MPDSFVIFICDFDPFGGGKYQYTARMRLDEMPEAEYEDGTHTIFLSTKGKNESEIPGDLAAFLKFAGRAWRRARQIMQVIWRGNSRSQSTRLSLTER